MKKRQLPVELQNAPLDLLRTQNMLLNKDGLTRAYQQQQQGQPWPQQIFIPFRAARGRDPHPEGALMAVTQAAQRSRDLTNIATVSRIAQNMPVSQAQAAQLLRTQTPKMVPAFLAPPQPTGVRQLNRYQRDLPASISSYTNQLTNPGASYFTPVTGLLPATASPGNAIRRVR